MGSRKLAWTGLPGPLWSAGPPLEKLAQTFRKKFPTFKLSAEDRLLDSGNVDPVDIAF